MPTIVRLRGIRFFFYSDENGEPPRIHVESSDKTAKFWLDPVELARSNGFRPQELTRLRATGIERRYEFLEVRHAHFDRSA